MLVLRRTAQNILHSYKEVKEWSHNQAGQTGATFEPKKILRKKDLRALDYLVQGIVTCF